MLTTIFSSYFCRNLEITKNNAVLFFHPYTKIEYMQTDMMVQRRTEYVPKMAISGTYSYNNV